MASDNVSRSREALEAFRQGGVETLLAFVHPDCVNTTPPELTVEPATYRGHDGLRRYFAEFYDVMDEVRFEPIEFIDRGERVVVPVRLVARGRATGIEAAQDFVMVWAFREGLVSRSALLWGDISPHRAGG